MTEIFSHASRDWKFEIIVPACLALSRTSSWLVDDHPLNMYVCGKERKFGCLFFLWVHSYHHRVSTFMTSSKLITFYKRHPLILSYWVLGVQHMDFEGTQIFNVWHCTPDLPKFISFSHAKWIYFVPKAPSLNLSQNEL